MTKTNPNSRPNTHKSRKSSSLFRSFFCCISPKNSTKDPPLLSNSNSSQIQPIPEPNSKVLEDSSTKTSQSNSVKHGNSTTKNSTAQSNQENQSPSVNVAASTSVTKSNSITPQANISSVSASQPTNAATTKQTETSKNPTSLNLNASNSSASPQNLENSSSENSKLQNSTENQNFNQKTETSSPLTAQIKSDTHQKKNVSPESNSIEDQVDSIVNSALQNIDLNSGSEIREAGKSSETQQAQHSASNSQSQTSAQNPAQNQTSSPENAQTSQNQVESLTTRIDQLGQLTLEQQAEIRRQRELEEERLRLNHQNNQRPHQTPDYRNTIPGKHKITNVPLDRSYPYDGVVREFGMLGEPTEENKGKKCLVIDLDETLVHSSFSSDGSREPDFTPVIEIDGIPREVSVGGVLGRFLRF